MEGVEEDDHAGNGEGGGGASGSALVIRGHLSGGANVLHLPCCHIFFGGIG
jgi:hypothetical protein